MIHIFRASDGSWIYSGTMLPSNLDNEEYVEGVVPEGEKLNHNYHYTCVDGVAVKGAAVEIIELEP